MILNLVVHLRKFRCHVFLLSFACAWNRGGGAPVCTHTAVSTGSVSVPSLQHSQGHRLRARASPRFSRAQRLAAALLSTAGSSPAGSSPPRVLASPPRSQCLGPVLIAFQAAVVPLPFLLAGPLASRTPFLTFLQHPGMVAPWPSQTCTVPVF